MNLDCTETTTKEEPTSDIESDDDLTPLRCWDCNLNFTTRPFLHKHLLFHIKHPRVELERMQLPPLKLTLKSLSGNSFEIINSPTHSSTTPLTSPSHSPEGSATGNDSTTLAEDSENPQGVDVKIENGEAEGPEATKEAKEEPTFPEENEPTEANVTFSPNFVDVSQAQSPNSPGSNTDVQTPSVTPEVDALADAGEMDGIETITTPGAAAAEKEYGNVPGAEPTPPPESDFPKIRIKTTGLLKEPMSLSEITDDNNGDNSYGQNNSMWSTPALEDPLKLPDSNDDSNILALFNNNEKAKDFGFCTSDSEFISLDRLDDRNRGTMQLYNSNQSAVVPTSNSNSSNALNSLTGLPMEALAQQVSRLTHSGSGTHQQNVLINIQQFQQPQPQYQPPPMYPHHTPQPMYQPYPYQPPPNPMYYPPAPGYPPQHMPPPPQPHMGQMPQGQHQQMGQPNAPSTIGAPPNSQGQNMNMTQYNQQPRLPGPRPQVPGQRMPMGAPRGPAGVRPQVARQPMNRTPMQQPQQRPRAPMVRPRGGLVGSPRGPRPLNGQVRPNISPIKRTPEQMAQLQAKKKRLEFLNPDKDDDDCQVISMQPKNTDGGLPQIESVQGGTSDSAENSIMHLSDSITLSVRNPPPKPAPVSPKKSDAKAVANILATRGITVTATGKQKEAAAAANKSAPTLPASLNLNGAVSILPAAKQNGNVKAADSCPTVDLTDDSPLSKMQNAAAQKARGGLPFKCDLCNAQYPNALGLNKHRQTYHKTTSGMCELGIPLINLKQPGILQKLTSLGINNYVPLPASGPEGTFAMPIISTRNPGNVSALGASQMLTLGPIKTIPKPQVPAVAAPKGPAKPF